MHSLAIGQVTGVHGYKVKVELDQDQKSPVRASLDGAKVIVTINSYLTFEIGGGESALAVITDLEARESFDPGSDELTLEFVRPRRMATAQLLGTVRGNGSNGYTFDPGITVLPTLDTPAIPAGKEVLDAVFTHAPKRNKPVDHVEENGDFDTGLNLGVPAGAGEESVLGSFNDLFSRPLAVVGNTGSGKSCTIAHLLQSALKESQTKRPRFFVLDINGEYATAFGKASFEREPNTIYVNGTKFGVPVWLMNANEVCNWLSAAEQVQEPVLKNLWSLAKGGRAFEEGAHYHAQEAYSRLVQLKELLARRGWDKGKKANEIWDAFKSFEAHLPHENKEMCSLRDAIEAHLHNCRSKSDALGDKEEEILTGIERLRLYLSSFIADDELLLQESADKPIYFKQDILHDPATLFTASRSEASDTGLQQNLRGLELRLCNRLKDKRWGCLFNYESLEIKSFQEWLAMLGIGVEQDAADDICVIDCSMLSYEVLPYVCGVIGRTLLELREHVDAGSRFYDPWELVLEEAHNYVRPRRQIETKGIAVSRDAFERIAKEGRKFGLSLIVASQRPSEISPTVLSQCANFIMHRLQNPEDIEHFRSIVPSQSRRLLDQVSILSPGEGIVMGSAFHIPSRVKVQKPKPEPSSQSSAPYLAWQPGSGKPFALDKTLTNWGIQSEKEDDSDDDMPF